MPDHDKKTEVICTKVSERMALDILRLAAIEDRSVSEWLNLLLREKLYGASIKLSSHLEQSTK